MNTNYVTGFNTNDDCTYDGLEFLIDLLPHGSGIDCTWGIHKPKNGRYVYFTNSYHCMNDNGYYVGYQDFSIVIPSIMIDQVIKYMRYTDKSLLHSTMRILSDMFTLQFNNGQYLADRFMLRDYLEETIAYSLSAEQARIIL